MNEYNIGSQLKSLRKARNVTLQYVAAETGLSAPLLSQIENNNVTPSLRTLSKLADYFHVRLGRLFDGVTEKPRYEIFRKMDACRDSPHEQIVRRKGNSCYSLLPFESGKRMNCSLLDLRSERGVAVTPRRQGETFLYIISGKVEIGKNGEFYTVEAGDCVYFDSSLSVHMKPVHCSGATIMRVETG
ncbi:MAG: helix-turn-helix domain-containing protein [Geobacteraceae bacterium]|nr:helix-turn-helix domain-containing protein [Geobacteraceae bacterium]